MNVIDNIQGWTVNSMVAGYPIHFERRRYGKTMFTWVKFYDGKEWIECGDPWPFLNVSVKEIQKAIEQRKAVQS